MAITTAAQLAAKLSAKSVMAVYHAGVSSLTAGALGWQWATTSDVTAGSLTFSNVTSGVAFDYTTTGAKKFPGMGGSEDLYLAYINGQGSVGAYMMLYDILYGVGPIPTSTAQTLAFSGQPTTWQDRVYGDYKTVQAFLVQSVAQGSYATTVTVGYTNENGTSGRTGTITETISANPVANMRPLRLDAGDCGIQQLDSVTISGTVSTAGVINLILARLIGVAFNRGPHIFDTPGDPATMLLTKVHPNSCLSVITKSLGTNPILQMQAGFIKG